mmetsp:Transcript_81692/g.135074  ORF Transcript_81692/g.135074 Transcript_81692/m.135074 type:complete len:276 (-) Transcript_81692:95-922(-)
MAERGPGLTPAQMMLANLQQEIATANLYAQNTANVYADYMQQYQSLVTAYEGASSSSSSAAQTEQAAASAAAAAAPEPEPAPEPKAKSQEESVAELTALEDECRQAEERAKRAASQSKHFVGIIARFDTRKGHGFVACEETYRRYKQDIFIDRESYQTAKVGDTVVFSLGFNKKGAVRACDVRKLNEVSRLKAELEQKRQEVLGVQWNSGAKQQDKQGFKRASPWNATGSSWAQGSTWSDNHNAKRNSTGSSWAEGSTWTNNHSAKRGPEQFVQW